MRGEVGECIEGFRQQGIFGNGVRINLGSLQAMDARDTCQNHAFEALEGLWGEVKQRSSLAHDASDPDKGGWFRDSLRFSTQPEIKPARHQTLNPKR